MEVKYHGEKANPAIQKKGALIEHKVTEELFIVDREGKLFSLEHCETVSVDPTNLLNDYRMVECEYIISN